MATEREIMTPPTAGPQRRRNHAIWLGVVLVLVGLLTYLYSIRFPALRDFPWVNLPLVLAGVIVSAIGFWQAIWRPSVYRGKILGGLGLALSLAITIFFIYGVFFLTARVPAPTSTSLAMTVAPDFTLMNQSGEPVRLSQYRGQKVVLIFYRGYW